MSTTPSMTPEVSPVPEPPNDPQLASEQLPHHKVRVKKLHQRSCNLKDEKNKMCGGHLKRWFYASDRVEQECGDIAKTWGPDREVYRCEYCKTLYLPNPEENRKNVAGVGMTSVFGLTVPPKEEKK